MNSISRRSFLLGVGAAASAGLLVSRSPLLAAAEPAGLASRLAADPLRPQFHLLPAANWMNDPNGPIFLNGVYHMFFQYNPNASVWGDMHWAHATSADMVHWKHQLIAIAPTPGGYDQDGVFSGCIVMDGLLPTAIYTGVRTTANQADATLLDGVHVFQETQGLAISRDNLQTWQKTAAPIIERPPAGMAITGFRDPCVWREGNNWMLALGSGVPKKGGAILLYRSPDLHHWTYLHPLLEGASKGSDAINPVDAGDMWECPDFFPLGDRHVLLISTMGKVFWKSGKYAAGRFTSEREGMVDFGSYYAARTMLDRNRNRILWGWIPETRPEAEHRAAGWACAISLPRVLTLSPEGDLRMEVAGEVDALRGSHTRLDSAMSAVARQKTLAALRIRDLSAELQLEFMPEPGREFAFELRGENDEPFASMAYNPANSGRELRINKTFAALPVAAGKPVHLRLFLDGSVLEWFANSQSSITERVYTVPKSALKILLPNPAHLKSLDCWQIRPISKDRLTT